MTKEQQDEKFKQVVAYVQELKKNKKLSPRNIRRMAERKFGIKFKI